MSLAHLHYLWRSTDPVSSAIRLSCWYIVIAGAWVLFSDRLLVLLTTNAEQLTGWQTIKGWIFVLIMAAWLGVERWRAISEQARINDELRAANTALQELNATLEQRINERTAPLQAANVALSQLNEELEAFIATVSHDLKAPLRAIEGYSQLLLRFYVQRLDDDGQQCLHSIRAAISQMNKLIDGLLEYTRIERKPLTQTEIHLEDVIEQILIVYADQIQRHGVVIERDLRCTTIYGDEISVTVALRNLIDNALKFSAHVPQPRLAIGADIEGNNTRLWVKDNGIGFDMRQHDRIFGVFQRLHSQETYPGSGMGLAIVRKAIERMGGRVWAESSPGIGTTFYLEFPNASASTSPAVD
ncbi:sensor histidine kinase [Chloroflexus sp.]|uniref:sensor histidine kinase n=1 Tax=Chloroflexus sp. TaxID=1904827 RepID=UPI00261E299E|nr:ATP-binding protein [uncultured Chloroflexus sp.]